MAYRLVRRAPIYVFIWPARARTPRPHPGPRTLSDIGKPRLVGDPDADAAELATWRQGMQKLAQLPQVCVRLESMALTLTLTLTLILTPTLTPTLSLTLS